MSNNSKMKKGYIRPKSASIDEEGQLELYSPIYALKVKTTMEKNDSNQTNNNKMTSKMYKGVVPKSASTDDEGQLELYSPQYALKVNTTNSKVIKDEGMIKEKKQKEEEKETIAKGGPLATPLPVRLTSRI